jgi:hypothetical protein
MKLEYNKLLITGLVCAKVAETTVALLSGDIANL